MMAKIHQLRRSEEGQTLVLAAIFGLVLMLCVLSTVNLGRAVYQKVQLQTAADAAAYSQAAVEARVLNFTAYTNRAMVVHYASIMAANRTNIEPCPDRITGFPYESSLQLKVRDLPRCGGAALALTLFPIILMYDVEVAKPRQFL